MPPFFIIQHDATTIHLVGGAPLAEPWSSPEIEALVRESDVFWNEVPEIGAELQALAIKYGVDPTAPLATWLTDDELARLHAAAETLGVSTQLLAPLRPWLAAQILKIAVDARAGLAPEHAVETHLTRVAQEAGVPVRSEFGTPEDVFGTFSGWPKDVQVQRLLSQLDEIDRGIVGIRQQSDAWRAGDLGPITSETERLRLQYPALYEALVIDRNAAWIDRIRTALDEGTNTFICAGSAHLVGPDSVPAMLERAGIAARAA